jgi:hypothetical protein
MTESFITDRCPSTRKNVFARHCTLHPFLTLVGALTTVSCNLQVEWSWVCYSLRALLLSSSDTKLTLEQQAVHLCHLAALSLSLPYVISLIMKLLCKWLLPKILWIILSPSLHLLYIDRHAGWCMQGQDRCYARYRIFSHSEVRPTTSEV